MIKRILLGTATAFLWLTVPAQEIQLKGKMKISKSVRIKKATYLLGTNESNEYVILIEGNNIVVDFNNASIVGNNMITKPDAFTGVCILVRNSKNVTIK